MIRAVDLNLRSQLISQFLILARDSDNDVIKIVVGVVFLAIWGLGALISSLNKKAEEERRRRQLGQLPQSIRQAPYGQQPYPAQYPAQYPPQTPYGGYAAPQPPPPPPQETQRKRRRKSAAAPPVPTSGPPEMPAPAVAVKAEAAAPGPAIPEIARIARLVHRPDSLRAALILNEVLSPPVSLRQQG